MSFKDKSKNKTKLFLVFSIISIISIIFIFFISSCSALLPSAAEKTDVDNPEITETSEPANDDIDEIASEETMALEEDVESDSGEIIEEIDFDNAVVDAEVTGYIPSVLCTNKDNLIRITITNKSDFTWRNKKPGAVRISYHYYGQDVDFSDYDNNPRTELPKKIEPGETISVEVLVNSISNAGYYIIQIDPILEGNENPEDNFWFSNKEIKMIEGLCYFGPCGEE